ncbi:hypothetical protein [Bacillus thuringiensis]|uniref:hypothetical protein n=1 Tax=Bacillus thuringiensis TaxID=1428 RepID=UPI00119DCD70|nr:hypothetical protein [Bacillus thuringiensis]
MIQLTVKGKPSQVRHLANDPEYLFAMEFHDLTKQTTRIGKENVAVKVTTLIRPEQWKQLLQMIADGGDTLSDANEIMMEGKMDHLPEEVYTFAPKRIMYRSHSQQRQEEKDKALQNQLTVSKRVVQLHAKYDGVCQKCGQRCDKKVVTIKKIQSKMGIICPDCKNETVFSVRNVKSQLQEELLQRNLFLTKQEIVSYFQQFCSQFVLANHQTRDRIYWTWDKTVLCRTVHVSQEGTVYKVQLQQGKGILPEKPKPQVTIEGITYQIYHLDRSRALSDVQKASIKEEDIQEQVRYYENKKTFSEKIIVKRKENAKRYEVLSGYTSYQAAKKIKPRHIDVTVVK